MSPDLIARWEALGQKGLTVSICYGPSGTRGLLYSVQVLSASGEEFNQPFAAASFEQAIWIAETESENRGWLT